ncbi:MAG: hypothetical protein WDN76_09575 [Alphaproteobacteria bacterium]
MPMQTAQLPNGARLVTFLRDQPTRQVARSNNFALEWIADSPRVIASSEETIVIFPDGEGRVHGDGNVAEAPNPSIVIVPPGRHEISAHGAALILSTDEFPIETRDSRVAPIAPAFERLRGQGQIHVYPFADIPLPKDNNRIRFVQSATMSVNIVMYDGARGRKALSPHAHADIEQGSLALAGNFVHHLRTPWGTDADAWLEDVHLEAGPDSMILIPPQLVHTSEGVGEGAHILLDIFAPPRRDFRAKGWFANGEDYADLAAR